MFIRSATKFVTSVLLLPLAARLSFSQDLELGDPGVAITEEQYNATWTHMVGFEGCNGGQEAAIIQAFWDAARVLNRGDVVNTHSGNTGINWAGAAAVEYLGAPFSGPLRESMQSEYMID